jgi:hypothetical protein
MSASIQQVIARYIAIDAHKHYVVVGGLNAQMDIALPLRRIDISRCVLGAAGSPQAVLTMYSEVGNPLLGEVSLFRWVPTSPVSKANAGQSSAGPTEAPPPQ